MRVSTGFAVVLAAVLALPATAAPVLVTVQGEVEGNQISSPPLGNVNPGDPVVMTFAVDSDNFMDGPMFPVRGYEINPMSFSFQLGTEELDLQDPFPAGETPWFSIRNDDPAVDGFILTTVIEFPAGVPISQTGIFGQFLDNFYVTYTGDTLSSLDILDALGTYDFDGLTVFNWTVDDGPFNPLIIVFETMTLEALVVDSDGDGVPDDEDLCPETVIPESVPEHSLGTNRWALVDEGLVFDTNLPPGGGPGFMFDTSDTAGCSCEQIIEARGLGNGHRKFGCSNGVMLSWVNDAAGAPYDDGEGDMLPAPGAVSADAAPHGAQHLAAIGNEDGPAATTAIVGDRLRGATVVPEEPGTRQRKTGGSRR